MNDIRNIGSTRGNIPQKNRPTIGFIIPEVETQVNSQIWAGVVDAARALNVNLIGFAGYELQRPDAFKAQGNIIYDLICAENVAGLVLWTNALSNYAGPEAARKLYKRFPTVPMVELEVPTNLTENYSYRAMGAVIRHLIERHACRQIAFIRGPAGHQEAENRYQAYRDVLQTAQFPADPERVVLADDWFEPSGKKAIQILLDQRHATFDAVAAANDLLAMGAIQALQERGIRVPNNVAVAGFDDIIAAQYYTPPLTTVRYPLYEMGWQAIEALATEIAGEAFERNPFPVQLRIRQSCGCLPSSVTQVAAGEVAVIGEPFESAFATRRETLLIEIQRMSENAGVTFEWTERLVDAFASEIKGDLGGEFIAILNDVLDQAIKVDGNVADWQEVISVLYHQVLPCLEDRRSIVRAEDVWQQARVLIGEATTRARMSQAVKKEQQTYTLFKIVDRLSTAFDIVRLMDILAEELPCLEIPSCYLSLYEDPQAPTDMARLILAYTDQGRVILGERGQPFPAKHLVPAQFLPQDRQYTLLLYDLYFHDQQIGFVLFEVSSRWKNVYETLCGLISSALQGALLVQRVQERTAEVTRQKYILDTFMANVPDSIYFKDRDSRITQANQAHARGFGLSDPSEEIGKTDFDFFPEEQARPKYEQEQDIMRTGQPILGLEEPDAGGRWALTTKMPLCDEHGAIIGTFGISRDITPLKQAQFEVAAAYDEIKILNNQLKDENLHMHAEMDVARRIQTALLPLMVKHLHPDFEIAAVMLPAEEVGGDYYDITLDCEGTLWLGIGDVSGHGVTPGLIMMMAQTVHTTITTNYQASAREIVCMINKVLFKNVRGRLEEDHFMTFTTLKYLGDGRFQHAGSHLALIVYRQRTQTCALIDTTGTWLNFIPDIAEVTQNAEFMLEIGDLLVLYTDGLTEAFSPQDEILDIHRFVDIVRRHAENEVEACRDAVIADVMAWCQGKQHDDMSLVVVRRIR